MAWLIQNGLATPKAKNVISESILEVELDLDVIRRKPQSPDPLGDLEEPLASEWNRLRAIASGKLPALVLDGTNHMVFNPRKWKEIIINTNDVPILVPDSVKEPLGVSALEVTGIVPVQLMVTPIARLALSQAKVLYRFEQMDYYPMAFRTLPPQYGPINTFLPHVQQAQKVSRRLTRVENRGAVELHWWYNQNQAIQNNVRLYHPDWIVKIDFKDATLEPPEKVDEVRFDLDIICGSPGGQVVTNKYQQVLSKSPIAITRAYQANFRFQTKYHREKKFFGYREGRHLMMDGEALQIIKITPNEVHLVSDLEFGGNGKLYIKKWNKPAAGGAGAAAPRPVPNTNSPSVGPVPNTNSPAVPPSVPPPKN
jgi:hypothetical protein